MGGQLSSDSPGKGWLRAPGTMLHIPQEQPLSLGTTEGAKED